MLSWWGKSSSKEAKPKATKESFINSLYKKLSKPETKSSSALWLSQKHASDMVSERGSLYRAVSRSSSPSSKNVGRCQSFQERSQSQPLPLPGQHRKPNVSRTDSGLSESVEARLGKVSKTSSFFPLPRPACIRQKMEPSDADGEVVVASICSECSIGSDDPADSRQRSPLENKYEIGCNKSSDQSPVVPLPAPMNLSSNKSISTSPPKRDHLRGQIPHLLVPNRGAFCSHPDRLMSSPSRTLMGTCAHEQIMSSGKCYLDFPFLGSDQCSSPGSGQTSGYNSRGGGMSGQLFWHHSRGSPEYSPNPSPRITSSGGPCSKNHSGAVTLSHHRAGVGSFELQCCESKHRSHPLPLPPLTICHSTPFSQQNSAATSHSVPRSPARAKNLTSPGSCWKKGKLLGQGTFGHVYVGFNSETGEMCAMKEVTLFADDAKSKESTKQLGQEIALLSRLRHPYIVQYYGSEMVGDKLYIYLEYVSGGSIRKILQESAIRSYTQQILSGLACILTCSKHSAQANVGHAGTFQRFNAERINSFRVSKSNIYSRDIHIPRNISCPVSPIGSPLLYSRSPQHLSGMMSPSSLSSPMTTSGSSTPIEGGFGAISFQNQLISSSKDGFVHSRKNAPGPCISRCHSNWDPNIFREVHSGFRTFQEPSSFDNKEVRPRNATNGELRSFNAPLDLHPSPSLSRPINRG